MWACIAWMPLANMYIVVKAVTTASYFAKENETAISWLVPYIIILSLITAVIQSGKALPGLPSTSVLKRAIVKREIWCHFNFLTAIILGKSPFVVLLVGTNPFLYGSALLAIVFTASFPILLTATLFTIGQVFLKDPDFRLPWRGAV